MNDVLNEVLSNMEHDKYELPPLPPLHIVPSVEPVDYPEVAQAFMDYALAAIEADRLKKEDYINDDRDMLRAEIVALKGTIADLEAECEELRKDAERYRSLLEAVLREIPHRKGNRGNAPGHGHSVPGIWDEDNGALAGKECAWCKVWNEAVSAMQRTSGGAA